MKELTNAKAALHPEEKEVRTAAIYSSISLMSGTNDPSLFCSMAPGYKDQA
jgi:hypothetical protein